MNRSSADRVAAAYGQRPQTAAPKASTKRPNATANGGSNVKTVKSYVAGGRIVTEAERECWEGLVARQHRRWEIHRDTAASRPNSAPAMQRRTYERLQAFEASFRTCLADLPEIQRTDPEAAAGLLKLERAQRRSLRAEQRAQATADRLAATWTVSRGFKIPQEYQIGERNDRVY